MSGRPAFSVVVPARDAEATLADTLEALRAQTHPDWEALVVDDGSSDGTAALASRFAADEPRVRVLSRPPRGVSAARNAGIEAATHPWLLFLDADDVVEPTMLERVARRIARSPEFDLVQVGWAIRFADGRVAVQDPPVLAKDLFTRASMTCPFPIHTAVVRRELVRRVGGFDGGLRTSEDWDLWLRCGRAGARVGYVDEVLAYYCMRSGSASTRAASALHDGLLVTRRAHAPDPRVPHAVPAHARGAPRSELAQAEYRHLAWVAGLAVAAGEDPTPALDAIPDPGRLPLQPTDMAGLLFAAVLVGRTVSPEQWVEVWPQVRAGAAAFLEAVEARTGSPGFAARTRRALAGLIVECSSRPLGAALEGVLDVEVDATRPVRVDLPPGASRIHARVRVGAIEIGRLTVPVLAGSDPGALLADEIDRRFAWPILAARDRLADGGRSPLVATLARVLPDTLAQGSSEALRRLHRRGHEWLERGLVRHRHSGTLTSASYVSVSRGANGSPGADPAAASVAETGADHPRPAGRGARHPAADAQLVIQRTLPPLRRALGRRAVAERLPILAYHRVAPSPDGASGRFQVDPERFERHLAFLRERGFRSVTLEDWQAAARGRLVLRGRPLVITFDDGYADFADIAAPLLRRYGFEAYVFVVTSLVGGTSCWDRHLGLEAPLLGWREMRALERDGVRFGSHTARHLPLAALEPEQIEREIRESRIALATRLERPSPSLAYPYGDVDDVVRFMARRIGVRFGLTTRCEPASRYHDALDLPRLEVFTWDDPADLAARIGLPATEVTG